MTIDDQATRARVGSLDIRPLSPAIGVETPNEQLTPSAVFTDAGGAFRIPALAPGSYRISARKPQFTEVSDGPAEVLTLHESREDVHLQLSPLGVIEGKVVDQDGQPVRGVNIVFLYRTVEDGRRVVKFSACQKNSWVSVGSGSLPSE